MYTAESPCVLFHHYILCYDQCFSTVVSTQATLETVSFQKLDFGETSVLDVFYNADVAIVDMSVAVQQAPLFYHIGIRQSMGMTHNIVILYDVDPETTLSLRVG